MDWRKTSDRFNLSMHISYPNISDSARARREGVEPGGMIMIHGTPDTEDNPENLFHTLDWTDGCIAMRNMDMREVWGLVPDGTMIEIRPNGPEQAFPAMGTLPVLLSAPCLQQAVRQDLSRP